MAKKDRDRDERGRYLPIGKNSKKDNQTSPTAASAPKTRNVKIASSVFTISFSILSFSPCVYHDLTNP